MTPQILQVLIRSLREGDPSIDRAAAHALWVIALRDQSAAAEITREFPELATPLKSRDSGDITGAVTLIRARLSKGKK